MSGPYRATTVANEFFELAHAAGRRLTPMQYVKLTYIAHGWSLALFGRPLIREPVEAWKYGPVIPTLYRELKHFGSGPVTTPPVQSIFGSKEPLDQADRELIADVYRKYGTLSGVQLSHLTHRPGTPWSEMYDPEGWGIAIPDRLIRSHYEELKAAAH
jgi:uncharacterized phage-associated protein